MFLLALLALLALHGDVLGPQSMHSKYLFSIQQTEWPRNSLRIIKRDDPSGRIPPPKEKKISKKVLMYPKFSQSWK